MIPRILFDVGDKLQVISGKFIPEEGKPTVVLFVVKPLNFIHERLAVVVLENFHHDNLARMVMDHLRDGRLIHRDENDMNSLFRDPRFGGNGAGLMPESFTVNIFAVGIKAWKPRCYGLPWRARIALSSASINACVSA